MLTVHDVLLFLCASVLSSGRSRSRSLCASLHISHLRVATGFVSPFWRVLSTRAQCALAKACKFRSAPLCPRSRHASLVATAGTPSQLGHCKNLPPASFCGKSLPPKSHGGCNVDGSQAGSKGWSGTGIWSNCAGCDTSRRRAHVCDAWSAMLHAAARLSRYRPTGRPQTSPVCAVVETTDARQRWT